MKLMRSKSSFLGVAVGERAISIAEIAPARNSGWEVKRAAEFVPPADGDAGEALGKFLREKSFAHTASVVVGVPARWLVARERELPPTSEEQASEILRLQAERLFSAELGDLVVDYAGMPDASGPRGVLLLAMPRKQLDRVVKMFKDAGREIEAVMPSTLALAEVGELSDGLILNVSGDAVELSAHRAGSPSMLRHLPLRGQDFVSQNGARDAVLSSLAGEIRRTVALMSGGAGSRHETLQLWDGIGIDHDDASNLARQAGVSLPGKNVSGVASLGLASLTEQMTRFGPALALAIAGATQRPGAVDFLHPRLAPPRKQRLGKRGAWLLGIVAAMALILIGLWIDASIKEARVETLRAQLVTDSPRVKDAEHTLNLISSARGWYGDGRPAVLECLREITDAFPDGGEAIYVRKFNLPESREGQMIGNAPDRELVVALSKRLAANKNFTRVRIDYMLDAGGNSNEVTYSISFTYRGVSGSNKTAPAQAVVASK